MFAPGKTVADRIPRRAVRLPGPGVFGRVLVFVGCVLLGLGLGLLAVLAVCARIAAHLDTAGQAGTARFVQSAGTVAVTLMLATVVLVNASLSYVIGARRAAAGLPALARGLVVRLGTRPPST